MHPAPPARCRVLDLGCSDGGNLISTALTLPESELVGIDLSPVQIEQGRASVTALGIKNVRLEVGDLLDLPDLGQFDYVISYGLLSWVPLEVREALLCAIKASLAPGGVAYLNYNTYPGWHLLDGIREMLQYRADSLDSRARVTRARAVLQFLAAAVPDSAPLYRALIQDEWKTIQTFEDHDLRWDLLGDSHHPLYFHEFVALLQEHGLQHLSEANLAEFLPENALAPSALEVLPALAPTAVARQQYLDFLVNRAFRRSLLCHGDVQLQRQLSPDRLETLHVASRAGTHDPSPDLCSDAKVEFVGPNGTLWTRHPLSKGALAYLTKQWPAWVPVPELAERARAWMAERGEAPEAGANDAAILSEHLLVAYSRGMLELHRAPLPFTRDVGQRPFASPLARWRLEQGEKLPNLRHEVVRLEAEAKTVLPLLDGTRDRSALLAELPTLSSASLEEALRELAVSALLLPSD